MDQSNVSDLRVCGRCKSAKPLPDFSKNAARKDGYRFWCRSCETEQRRIRRLANIESERAREAAAKRARYKSNPELYLARTKRAYEANREQHIKWMREWRLRFPEKQALSERRWRAANPEKARAKINRQQARRRGAATSGSPIDLSALWTGFCGICGSTLDKYIEYPDPLSKSLDHITPIFLGGSHEQSNLQWAHLRCNLKKGARPPL